MRMSDRIQNNKNKNAKILCGNIDCENVIDKDGDRMNRCCYCMYACESRVEQKTCNAMCVRATRFVYIRMTNEN